MWRYLVIHIIVAILDLYLYDWTLVGGIDLGCDLLEVGLLLLEETTVMVTDDVLGLCTLYVTAEVGQVVEALIALRELGACIVGE